MSALTMRPPRLPYLTNTFEEASHKRGLVTILVAFLFLFCSKLAEFLHVVFNVIEKRVPVFLPLVFASFYKDAARKTEWFFAYAISRKRSKV